MYFRWLRLPLSYDKWYFKNKIWNLFVNMKIEIIVLRITHIKSILILGWNILWKVCHMFFSIKYVLSTWQKVINCAVFASRAVCCNRFSSFLCFVRKDKFIYQAVYILNYNYSIMFSRRECIFFTMWTMT